MARSLSRFLASTRAQRQSPSHSMPLRRAVWAREEFTFQSITVECPLCGEPRRYLPSEVFLGRPDRLVVHRQKAGGRLGRLAVDAAYVNQLLRECYRREHQHPRFAGRVGGNE